MIKKVCAYIVTAAVAFSTLNVPVTSYAIDAVAAEEMHISEFAADSEIEIESTYTEFEEDVSGESDDHGETETVAGENLSEESGTDDTAVTDEIEEAKDAGETDGSPDEDIADTDVTDTDITGTEIIDIDNTDSGIADNDIEDGAAYIAGVEEPDNELLGAANCTKFDIDVKFGQTEARTILDMVSESQVA